MKKKERPNMPFYIDHHQEGDMCPFCGNKDITGDAVEIVGTSAMQDVFCSACKQRWRDEFILKYTRSLEDT